MELDPRASDKKREVWNCLWFDCLHFEIVSLVDKDKQIADLTTERDTLRDALITIADTFCPQPGETCPDIAEKALGRK